MKVELENLINELNIKDNCAELVDNAIGMLMLDPIAAKNLIIQIAKSPIVIRDAIYWNKLYMFVTGINKIQEDLKSGVKLSNKLFDNPKNREQNGMRLLGYLDKADSKQKINYYINATRSLLMGNIDNTEYFRIMKAVSETLNEDLEYLSEIVENTSTVRGNMQLLALERSGLVIQAGIDANEDIESQNYAVSNLGRMVDNYALASESTEQKNNYKNEMRQRKLEVDLPIASEEDIYKMFE